MCSVLGTAKAEGYLAAGTTQRGPQHTKDKSIPHRPRGGRIARYTVDPRSRPSRAIRIGRRQGGRRDRRRWGRGFCSWAESRSRVIEKAESVLRITSQDLGAV